MTPKTPNAAPASSAGIPRLRAADLPQVPRRLSLMFAADVVAGDVLGVFFLLLGLGLVAVWLLMAANSDLRSSDADRACYDGVVTSRFESDDNWTARARTPVGDVDSFFFHEPPPEGASITVRGDASCARLHLDGGKLRRVPLLVATLGFFVPFALCLPLLVRPARRRWQRLHLLREGTLTTGTQRAHTINSEGDWDIHTFVFSFVDDRGQERTATATTARPGPLLDETAEPLIYDEHSAALLDALPGLPRIADARIVSSRPLKSAAVALVVVVTAVAVPVGGVVGLLLALR